MASNADKHTKRSVKHCKKCRQPVRGHIGPHGSLCRQPSPQFLEDVPSSAYIQEELEASIMQHQQDIANLTAELQLLQIHNSTPVSTANKPQMSSALVSQVKTSNRPNGSLVFTTVMCGSTLSSNMLGLHNQSTPASFPYAASNTLSTFLGISGHAQTLPSVQPPHYIVMSTHELPNAFLGVPPHFPLAPQSQQPQQQLQWPFPTITLSGACSTTFSGLQLATSLCLPTSNPQQSASFPVLSTLQPSVSLATWGSAHAGLPTSSTIQALPTRPFPSMVTPTASSKFTSPFPQQLPLQAQLGSGTLNPQSFAPPRPLPSASSFSNAQLVSLFQQFLEQVNSSSQPAPPSAPQPPSQVFQANTIADLNKHHGLQHQADAVVAALPLVSSSSALKGKSPGDLPYSAPIKFQQLWPHQFVTCLDSSNIKYTKLDLPQFVDGFLDCIRHSPAHQQPCMSTHLSHLMDLASRF